MTLFEDAYVGAAQKSPAYGLFAVLLSRIVRQLVPAPNALGPTFGVAPRAVIVMFVLTATLAVHVTDCVPVHGICTVSPFDVRLTAACTSDTAADAAVYVFARAGEQHSAMDEQTSPNHLIPLNTDVFRIERDRIFFSIRYIVGLNEGEVNCPDGQC
jgi:hypothetical protein